MTFCSLSKVSCKDKSYNSPLPTKMKLETAKPAMNLMIPCLIHCWKELPMNHDVPGGKG